MFWADAIVMSWSLGWLRIGGEASSVCPRDGDGGGNRDGLG